MSQATGPVILDLVAQELSEEERELLQHPLVGGVILFTRNYEAPEQLTALCHAVRAARKTPLLITVDQEGGRVQRFRHGFVPLPSMADIGKVASQEFSYACGWLMASELLAVGVDLSFAPVLDLDKNCNTVIGNRAFGSTSDQVITFARSFIQGMHAAGMAATGKHFPGHGSVMGDSHLELPVDARDFASVFQDDMQPFIKLIKTNLDAIMPAHIIFSSVDKNPVGFSHHWLQQILRQTLHFSGVIISDDLNMSGAMWAGSYANRAKAALTAGCDFVLICNNRQAAIEILDELPPLSVAFEKWSRLKGKWTGSLAKLHASSEWKKQFNQYSNYTKEGVMK